MSAFHLQDTNQIESLSQLISSATTDILQMMVHICDQRTVSQNTCFFNLDHFFHLSYFDSSLSSIYNSMNDKYVISNLYFSGRLTLWFLGEDHQEVVIIIMTTFKKGLKLFQV